MTKQLLYDLSELVLKIQVVDSMGRKYFKEKCNIVDKKRLAKIFSTLKSKYNIDIPEALRKEVDSWWLG